jgi:hypothetical protein
MKVSTASSDSLTVGQSIAEIWGQHCARNCARGGPDSATCGAAPLHDAAHGFAGPQAPLRLCMPSLFNRSAIAAKLSRSPPRGLRRSAWMRATTPPTPS